MNENEIPRMVMDHNAEGRRKVGGRNIRRKDCIDKDIRKLGIKNWWTVVVDRDLWRRFLKKAKARPEL